MKLVLEQQIDAAEVDTEDGGRAKIVHFDGPPESMLFVRLQSWDDTGTHVEINALTGRRVRVTIQVLE
jgi:hypothetical protein